MNQDVSQKPELRSEEVEDILGRVPGWITRNGILLMLIFVLILLLGAWVFKVPDIKQADISVTSILPPADIRARADGKIDALLVKDNERVVEGQVLAVIENSADYEDVVGLKKQVRKLHLPEQIFPELDLPVNGDADLGEVQVHYSPFYKSYRDYEEFLELNYHMRKIELLNVELEHLKDYSLQLEHRSEILFQDFELAYKQYQRDSVLFSGEVVSESAVETSKAAMYSKRDKLQEIEGLKAGNDIEIAKMESDILEMELKYQQELSLLTIALEKTFNSLKVSISEWERNYLIIAPISGAVTFNSFWSENQNVNSGEQVMTIIPDNAGALLGKILLPMQGAGEVQPGQSVNIRFENYPYLEYGMVKGIVSNVSKVPVGNFYTVEVKLPQGLRTYYGYEITFNQNMKGAAEIITDNMRLLQRIFNPLRNAISRQREM